MTPAQFYELTPAEFSEMVRGFNERREAENKRWRLLLVDNVAVPIIEFCRRTKHGTTTRKLLGAEFFGRKKAGGSDQTQERKRLRDVFKGVFKDFKRPTE